MTITERMGFGVKYFEAKQGALPVRIYLGHAEMQEYLALMGYTIERPANALPLEFHGIKVELAGDPKTSIRIPKA